MKKLLNKKNLWFIGIFTVVGFLAMQVPFTQLMGSKANFTLFDFFGPIAPAFIGLFPGIISVFLVQLFNFLIHGSQVLDIGTIIRFIPMLFAALYFGKKVKLSLIIPILAIIAFNLHPIGRSAWVYSLFWTIPIFCYFLRDRFLLAKSLGATFSAHAVGSALWVWTFGLSQGIWLGLIPITARERLLFAVGIAGTYLVFNNVLDFLTKKKLLKSKSLSIDPKYLLRLEK